jgi:hypothetical protein
MKRNSVSLRNIVIGLSAAIVLLMITTLGAYAQGSGKIVAKVVDGKTGEVLIRASVQIIETKQGAYTKDNGVGTISNVSPSETYHVVAKYASYKAQTIADVKVVSDQTTTLTFKLFSSGGDTLIISTEKIMVSKTTVDLGRKFSNSQVVNTPGRQRLDEIIRLTPGVYTDASSGGLSFNGSRGTSNSIRINGVETSSPVDGRTSALQNSLSKFAISEIAVVSAGGGAENGGYTGGLVNSQTKGGGEAFEFMFHYRQDVPALFSSAGNGLKQLGQNDKIYEFALGGPLGEDLHYFVTAKGNTRQFDNYFTSPVYQNLGLDVRDPQGRSGGQLANNSHYTRSVTGKLTFALLGFNISADADISSESRQFNGVGTVYADPANLTAQNEFNNIYSLTGRSQIGEGILELEASYSTQSRYYGKYDQSQSSGLFSTYKMYKPTDQYTYDDNSHTLSLKQDGIIDIYTPVSRQIPDPSNPAQILTLNAAGINPLTGHVEGPPITNSTNNAYGLANTFVVAGNTAGFSINDNNQIQVDAKYNQQIGQHFLSTGVEGHLYHLASQSNDLPWDPNPFRDSFDVKPLMADIYVQDKMEFSDITFQPGLRFDIFNSGSSRNITNPYDPVNRQITIVNGKPDTIQVYNVGNSPVQTQLSPRLGITYAVTEQTTFNFNYNWYFKSPLLTDVLSNTGGNLGQVFARGNQIVGNGALKAERTKEISVGFNSQLSDVFAMSVNGVYKDLRNLAGLQRISGPLLPIGYTLYSDDQYGNSRSLQLTLEKRMANNYSARLNYTYSVAKGTSATATSNYGALINYDPNSEQAVLPLTPFYLDYDKTHVAQFILDVNFGRGEGPSLFGTKFLQFFSFNSTTEYASGTPYTRFDQRGKQIGEYNGDREPSYFQTDAALTRTIPFADIFGESMNTMFLDLQLEVTNLFNRTEALFVYPTTGQGDNDGSNGKFLGTQEYYNNPTNSLAATFGNQLDAFGKLLYNPLADLNHDGKVSLDEQQTMYTQLRKDGFSRRTSYQTPRRFFFNVSFRF